jgi:transposase
MPQPCKNPTLLTVATEAGPTGYALYWQLTRMGAKCEVVAPTLVPVKAGDRVKTNRRDALKLARNYRAGELTAVWVPDAAHEALRDLVRAREEAKQDELRARHRLSKFLWRHGRRSPMGVKTWTMKYLEWMKREVHFEQMAQAAAQRFPSIFSRWEDALHRAAELAAQFSR